jgi:hypothetical protein
MDLTRKVKAYYRAYERHDPGHVAGELAEGAGRIRAAIRRGVIWRQ